MIQDLCRQAMLNATTKGFHEYIPKFGVAGRDARHILSWLMLITTEVAEAAEEVRKGRDRDKLAEELADVCIRTFDVAGMLGLDLQQAILDKIEANKLRPRLHGGKLA